MRGDVQAAAPLADGRYHLLEVLGEGGMAVVYRGFDVRLQGEAETVFFDV